MNIVRPIEKKDLDQVVALAAQAHVGLTTLPHDPKILGKQIEISVESFHRDVENPKGEIYFFVLEDIQKKRILGTSAIVSKVGGFEPFYIYEIKTAHKKSKLLKVEKEIQYLQLLKIHSGPSEIGTLFLSPESRKEGNGRLLSLSRFLFMAEYQKRFEKEVVAELRGVVDEQDQSPFWSALGKHFFQMDFKKADLMVMKDKSFIADLIPQHPIYISLLSPEAQGVIGEVHPNTRPALALLLQEGFQATNQVDIFEAGPLVKSLVKDIRSVRDSRKAVVVDVVKKVNNQQNPFIIMNTKAIKKVCMGIGFLDICEKDKVVMDQKTSDILSLVKTDEIRFTPIRGGHAIH